MPVDPVLWQAFHNAKDALLDALRSSAADTNYPHVLSRPPIERADALRVVSHRAAELDAQQRQLGAAKDDLSKMIGYITTEVQRARQSTSPVGVLPPELLRDIIHHSVGRRNHKEILSLASVCSLWRAAVHNERPLFADANWGAWNIELLELWNVRSRGCPLHVRINNDVSTRLSDDRYARTIQSTLSRWASLSFEEFSCAYNSSLKPLQKLFNQSPLNSLESLVYRIVHDDRLKFNAPNLISLQCYGPLPIPTSHPKHISLSPYRPRDWVSVQTFLSLSACQSLKELHVDLAESDEADWPSPVELPFTSLRHLYLTCAYGREVISAFRLATFPVLQDITLCRPMDPLDWGGGTVTALDLLSSRAPCVQRLQVVHDDQKQLAGYQFMDVLSSHPSIFPMLCDLGMRVDNLRSSEVQHYYDESVKRFVASRRIQRLSVPGLSTACIDDLRLRFGISPASTIEMKYCVPQDYEDYFQ